MPKTTRQATHRPIALQHDDLVGLVALGLVRADAIAVTTTWTKGTHWQLFHHLVFVWQGRARLVLEDREELLTAAGPGWWFPRHVPFDVAAEAGAEVLVVVVDPDVVPATGGPRPLTTAGALLSAALAALAETATHDAERWRQAWGQAATQALLRCWQDLGLTVLQANDHRLSHLLASINDAPDQPWTVRELARQLGCSATEVGRRFAAAGLPSPMRAVQAIRMRRAARLLEHSPVDLTNIARRVGFTSPFAFSRAFRRHHGHSPAQHRRGGAVT
jgi:AraC-like DNA-binding protein